MNNCALCQIKSANKTGSHIVPHFLLIRVDGIDGSKLRGKEVGSTITSSNSSTYFGREIQPDKLHSILGNYTDEDIAKMGRNPSIVDNIVCIECETRFGQLETEYAPTLAKFNTENFYKSDISSGAALLFWMSVLWRMSISNLYGFQLSAYQSELLRKILDKYTKVKFSQIDFEALYNDEECNNLAYRLIRCPNYSDENATVVVCHPTDTKPYSIMIDEYILFVYFNLDDIDKFYQNCFSFINIIKHAMPNTLRNGEYILPIRAVDVTASIKTLILQIKNERLNKYNELFNVIHKEFVGPGEMPRHIKQEIMDEITSDQKLVARKYTINDVINSIAKVLHKY